MQSLTCAECRYVERHYAMSFCFPCAQCRSPESCNLSVIILIVNMLSLILVNVIMLSFINATCHYAVMASAVMQNEPTRLTGNR